MTKTHAFAKSIWSGIQLHPWKLTWNLKIGHPQKETIVLQPSIFRCDVMLVSGRVSADNWWTASQWFSIRITLESVNCKHYCWSFAYWPRHRGFPRFPNSGWTVGFRLDLRVGLWDFLGMFQIFGVVRNMVRPLNCRRHHSGNTWMLIRRVFLFLIALGDCWIRGGCLFPTCQVRVVRFYVSLFSSFSSFSFSFSSASSSVSLSCCDSVCSVWHVGPQLRSCEFSVACWTSTAILWVQCGVLDPNRDPASSVWRAGPQPRSCEFSVASRTPTAILRIQCGVPDPNRDPVSSVWRAGPQVLCQKICQKEWQKICQKEWQKICQKKCQKDMSEDMSERMSKDMSERCQKECQKICQKECQKICQKEW